MYRNKLSALENLKMIEESDGFPMDEIYKRKKELSAEIYAMEHPVLKPMTEAELINFERMIEEEIS
jgi:hypothetical protein